MISARSVARGLWVLTHRQTADDELAEELAHFYGEAEAELKRDGVSALSAQQAVRDKFGAPSTAFERARRFGWERAVARVTHDARTASHFLSANARVAMVLMLALAVGIGAATTSFVALRPLASEPLPFFQPDRLVVLRDIDRAGESIDLTYGSFVELRSRLHDVASLVVEDDWMPVVARQQEERLAGARVSADYFRILGIAPVAGKDFDDDENQGSGKRSVLVSDRLAIRFFGRTDVIGKVLRLNGVEHAIIGVIPAQRTALLAGPVDVWAPTHAGPITDFKGREWGHHYRVIARMRDTVPLSKFRTLVDAIAANRSLEFNRPSWATLDDGVIARSLHDELRSRTASTIWIALAAALVLAIIVAMSVAIIASASAKVRQSELAVRAASAATVGEFRRQVQMEHALLALGATIIVVAVTSHGDVLNWFRAQGGLVSNISADAATLLFCVIAAALSAVGSWLTFTRSARPRLSGKHAEALPRYKRALLPGIQLSLTVVLVSGAGFFAQRAHHAFSTSAGFDATGLIVARVLLPAASDADEERQRAMIRIMSIVRETPGVQSAAYTTTLPLSGGGPEYGFELANQPAMQLGDSGSAVRYAVTPGYFETMRIPLRAGRTLSNADSAGAADVVVISASFAERVFGTMDPVGTRIRFAPSSASGRGWATIIGVVDDVRQESSTATRSAFYVPTAQWPWIEAVQSIVIRSAAASDVSAQELQRAIAHDSRLGSIGEIRMASAHIAMARAEYYGALAISGGAALAAILLLSASLGIARKAQAMDVQWAGLGPVASNS